jgi:hypothetical protein
MKVAVDQHLDGLEMSVRQVLESFLARGDGFVG